MSVIGEGAVAQRAPLHNDHSLTHSYSRCCSSRLTAVQFAVLSIHHFVLPATDVCVVCVASLLSGSTWSPEQEDLLPTPLPPLPPFALRPCESRRPCGSRRPVSLLFFFFFAQAFLSPAMRASMSLAMLALVVCCASAGSFPITLSWKHRGACFNSWCHVGWYSSPAVATSATLGTVIVACQYQCTGACA